MRGLFGVFQLPPLALLVLALGSSCSSHKEAPTYRTVQSTEFGKSLLIERTDAKTLQAALRLTLADITRDFGTAPSVFSAFADSRDPQSGGATFLVAAKGGQMKGLVTAKAGDASTRVVVTYIRADAPPGEWGRLLPPPPADKGPAASAPPAAGASASPAAGASASPSAGGAQAGSESAVAHLPLRTYTFPDGTGSIGLAEGWTTNAQSATRGSVLKGPNDASASLGAMYSVVMPGSSLPRTPGTLVAAPGTPAAVLQAVVPQFSQMSVRQGGPSLAIDHLSKVADEKPIVPGGQRWVLRYGITETTSGGSHKHYLAMAWVEVNPVHRGSFMVGLTQVRAPDATFDKAKPVMFQMLNSVRTNDAVILRKSANQVAAQKRWFNNQQQALRQQQAANDAQHKGYYEAQRERARSNDNFDEYIRGVRTVEDTQSGVKTSVDLGNVDKVVDTLNEGDPGRYRQIPLRDEAHP